MVFDKRTTLDRSTAPLNPQLCLGVIQFPMESSTIARKRLSLSQNANARIYCSSFFCCFVLQHYCAWTDELLLALFWPRFISLLCSVRQILDRVYPSRTAGEGQHLCRTELPQHRRDSFRATPSNNRIKNANNHCRDWWSHACDN